MSRIGLLFCALPLLACGASAPAQEPTQAVAPGPEEGALSGVSDLAILPTGDRAMPLLALHKGVHFLSSEGKPLSALIESPIEEPRFIDARGSRVWLASRTQLVELDLKNREERKVVTLPEGTEASGLELAYQGTVFVADAKANRILAVKGEEVTTLVEDAALAHPAALLLNGGSLIIGNESGLRSYNIKSGESKVLADDLGAVVGLAHDHLGYFLAATSKGELRQVKPDGSSKLLHTLGQAPSAIAFDASTRRLYLLSGESIAIHDYLALTGEDRDLWEKRDQRLMRGFSKNGMTLAGGEYWPSHGTTNVSYPDDILWGFYPSPEEVIEGEAAAVAPPKVAIECAEKSYQALQAFVDSNPAAFHKAAEATGASKQFYLWVNDYSDASKEFPHEQRMNKFWYWERKPAVQGRVPGFWKWETTLLQDGQCLWPEAEQIEQALKEKLSAK